MSDDSQQQRVITEIERLMQEAAGRISLAALGNRVAQNLGESFKALIPDVTLVAFIEDHFSDKISITGPPTGLIATLSPTLIAKQPTADRVSASQNITSHDEPSAPTRKYDATFWSAFFTPARNNSHRAIKPVFPFEWREFWGTISPGFIEIPPSMILGKGEPWAVRKRIVGTAIEKWCQENKLNPDDFRDQGFGHQGRIIANQSGAQTLLSMVSEVDESERSRLSLPFSIIYALLHR